MRYFPGTDIEVRSYAKWEVAALLGISSTRLTYVLKQHEERLIKLAPYSRKQVKLYPNQVRYMLEVYGVIG